MRAVRLADPSEGWFGESSYTIQEHQKFKESIEYATMVCDIYYSKLRVINNRNCYKNAQTRIKGRTTNDNH